MRGSAPVRTFIGCAAVLGAALALPLPASAAPVTLCGPTVCYEYDNNPVANAGITLFGAPSLLGFSDTLLFTPTSFSATATNGALVTTTSTFQFTRVYSTNGAEIANITVTEAGDYRILEGGYVGATLRLQSIDKVNNGGGGFPQVAITNPNPNWGTSVATGTFASPGTLQNWTLVGSLDPAATFQDLATEVDLQIQNTLDAFTFTSPSLAFIQKKLTITTTLVTIPVPAAAWLFGSALAGIALLRRKPLAA